MSVRRETITSKTTGKTRTRFMVDVDFEHPDGSTTRVRKVSPVATQRGAEQYERDIRKALADGTYGKEAPKAAPTMGEFWPRFMKDHCEANMHKPSGKEGKRSVFDAHLGPLFKDRRLDSFTAEDEATLKGRFRSPSTYNNAATVFNTVLTVAVAVKVIKQIPHRFKMLKRAEAKPKFYDFNTFDAVVSAAQELDPRYHLVALLGGDGGLRRGELIALEVRDIEFDRGVIKVARSAWRGFVTETKGLAEREVPMTTRLQAALRAHCSTLKGGPGARILQDDEGNEVTGRMMRTWMAKVQRRAGLAKRTGDLHILRHTFCSHLAMRGAPALSIQRLAGHRSLRTTLGYMHLADGETTRAIRLLEQPRPQHGSGNLTATEAAA